MKDITSAISVIGGQKLTKSQSTILKAVLEAQKQGIPLLIWRRRAGGATMRKVLASIVQESFPEK